MKKILLYLMIFLLLITATNAAYLHGKIYDNELKEISNVVLEINTNPKQRFVSKTGNYRFDVPEGFFSITANYHGNQKLATKKSINITDGAGDYTFDLILFPKDEEGNYRINIKPSFSKAYLMYLVEFYLVWLILIFLVLVLSIIFLIWILFKKNKKKKKIIDNSLKDHINDENHSNNKKLNNFDNGYKNPHKTEIENKEASKIKEREQKQNYEQTSKETNNQDIKEERQIQDNDIKNQDIKGDKGQNLKEFEDQDNFKEKNFEKQSGIKEQLEININHEDVSNVEIKPTKVVISESNDDKNESDNKQNFVPELSKELQELYGIIYDLGGRATQKEIRKHFTLSESKVSLMITELEAKGYIEKIKKGRGNIIILKKK